MKRITCLLLCAGALGCASIKTVKVPYPSSYGLVSSCSDSDTEPCWNELQREADAIEGVRYYLPRPYVAVKKEFPVAGGTYYVRAELNDDNQLVAVGGVPDEIKRFFPPEGRDLVGLRTEAPGAGAGEAEAPASDLGLQAEEKKEEKKAEKPAFDLVADSKDLLKDSTVSHASVPSKETPVVLTLKISKDLETSGLFGEGPRLLGDAVYLVPIVQGAHKVEGLVAVSGASLVGDPGSVRTLTAIVQGAKVPAHASLAVAVEGTKDGETKKSLLHRKGVDIVSSFAGGAGDKSDGGGEKEPAKQEVKGARATVSGDPTTSPLIKVSDLYDVLLLPDFSEQYAIQVRSGLFKAGADIGLENGWMAEKINVSIDNSQLGEFVLTSAGKLVEGVLGRVFPDMEAAQAQPEATDDELEQEAERLEKAGKKLLVRVDYVEYAVPGLHTLAKIREQECGGGVKRNADTGAIENLCVPRIAWKTRSEAVFTIVGLKPQEGAPPALGSNLGGCDTEDIKDFLNTPETFTDWPDFPDLFNGLVLIDLVEEDAGTPPGRRGVTVTVLATVLKKPATFVAEVESLKTKLLEVLNQALGEKGCSGDEITAVTFKVQGS